MNTGEALAVVIVGLALVIMLHELGHLLVAKACKMAVTGYFVGFGPKIWSLRRGETEYGVRAIPAGGYVKIPGMSNLEEVDPAVEGRTYREASFPRKIAVVSAGSVVHLLLAFLMLWALYAFVGMPSSKGVAVGGYAALANGSDPARSAGLKPGDVIVSAGGHSILTADQLTAIVHRSAGTPLTFTVRRDGTERRITVTPGSDRGRGMIGIEVSAPMATVNPLVAIPRSFGWIGNYIAAAGAQIGPDLADGWRVLTNTSVKASSSTNDNRPMSIFGATRIAAQAAQQGPTDVLLIFVMLNIFIGIFNILPIPVLDGGHVVMAVYERLRSRRGRPPYHADYAKLVPVVYVTLMALVLIGGSLMYLDIVKPIPSPFR